MSAKIKKTFSKSAKIFGVAVFAFLMFFNIKLAMVDQNSDDLNLFGLKLSLFVPSAYATEGNPGGGGGYPNHWTWWVDYGLCYDTELGTVCWMCCESMSSYDVCYHGVCGEGYLY